MRRLTLGLLAVCAWFALATGSVAQHDGTTVNGNQLLASALENLERQVSIAARLRHQSRLEEHTLVGSGKYWQSGTGNQRRSKWEMQTQIAGETASMVRVFDGKYLWTDSRLPSSRDVHRLDVARLQNRIGHGGSSFGSDAIDSEGVTPLLTAAQHRGGISQLLADLLQRFVFEPPRQTQVNGLVVYALVGRWKQEELRGLYPNLYEQTGKKTSWPEQLPHHVLVLLGRENLFPHVIEHRRAADAYLLNTVAGLRPTRDPLVRYEVFEVQYATAIDPRSFDYKPGDIPWTDETALVIDRLQQQRSEVANRAAADVSEAKPR